jgi:signal transduction histidine kinase
MAAEPVRVLLVEDDPDDHVLVRDWLAECDLTRFELTWVASYEAALEELAPQGAPAGAGRRGHDVCLLDYRLGRHDGLELLREARRLGWAGPLILLTGQSDRAVDLEAMQAGAADYLIKGQISSGLLERAIRYALERRQMHTQLEARVRERTEELARANDALAEADRRKDEFLGMLAHELRNPLAPLRNALEILKLRRGSDPVVRELSAMMGRQVDHVVRLVDDLLDVSRITKGKIELRVERVELARVVERAAESVRPLMRGRQHRLETEGMAEAVWVEGDPARLEQVLTNLLNNAARYTPPGGWVRVTLAREGDQAVMRVQDSGIGVRPEMLARIFEPFAQADRVEGQVSEGLGIGLSLVRDLVKLHGGSVTAQSPGPGLGSTFVVCLPALPPGAVNGEAAAPATGETPAGTPMPLRVLITDDNADAAESLGLLVRLMGHEVRTAHDGAAALAAARAFRPEVVFLDIGLPRGMDGYEVARRMRDEAGLHGALLVAMTGYGQPEDVARAYAAGMNHHVTKPADAAVLQSLLEEAAVGRGA